MRWYLMKVKKSKVKAGPFIEIKPYPWVIAGPVAIDLKIYTGVSLYSSWPVISEKVRRILMKVKKTKVKAGPLIEIRNKP